MSAASRVTDHAVLRWLERFAHVDVEAVRAAIDAETRDALSAGATRLKVNGAEYRMRDGKVVTVMPSQSPRRPLKFGDAD